MSPLMSAFFARLVRVSLMLLAFVTMLALPLSVGVLFGHGSISVRGEAKSPYTIGYGIARPDGSLQDIPHLTIADGIRVRANFPFGDEAEHLRAAPIVRSEITVGPEDRDTRAVIVASWLATLAALWLGAISLHRALAGRAPARRFRDLAIVFVGAVVAERIATLALNRTLDVVPDHRVISGGPGSFTTVLVAALLLGASVALQSTASRPVLTGAGSTGN